MSNNIICLINDDQTRVYVRVKYDDVCKARAVTYKGINYAFSSAHASGRPGIRVLGYFKQEYGATFTIPDDAEVVTP